MHRLATLMCLGALSCAAFGADLVLVGRDGPTCTISADEADREVAEELQTYLHRMTGTRPCIAEDWTGGARIVLGRLSEGDLSGLDLGLDGFVIRREGRTLRLAGATSTGTRNAVYRFLDMQGCRWYVPGPAGEVVPIRRQVAVGDIDAVHKPAFLHRVIWPSLARQGMSAADNEAFSVWLRHNLYGGVPVHVGHNFYQIAPSKQFFDQHPDWYALRQGKRDPGGQLCTTNPGLIEHTVQVARKWFDTHPEHTMFSLSPDDHCQFCHCDACDALDPEESRGKDTGKGRRLVVFASEVAKRLQETHPGKNVAFYAYWGAVEAPLDIEAHPNVIVFFTPIGMAFNHALQDPASPVNVKHNAWYEGWRKVAHQMGIRHYYNFSSVLWIPWRELASELRYQHEKRALYVDAELWADSEGSALTYYILGKVLWDLETDTDAVFEDFVKGMYGPAAQPMRRYYLRLSDAWRDCGKEVLWPSSFARQQVFLDVLTPRVLADCGDDLLEARRIAQSAPVVRERLRANRAWFGYMEAWARYASIATGRTPGTLAHKVSAADALVQACALARTYGPGAGPEMEHIILPETRRWAGLKATSETLTPAFPEASSEPPRMPPTVFRGPSRHLIAAEEGERFTVALAHRQVGSYPDTATYALLGPGLTSVAEGTLKVGQSRKVVVGAPSEGIYVLLTAAGSNAVTVDINARRACTDVAAGSRLNIAYHARPMYFAVPEGAKDLSLSLHTDGPAETVQAKLFAPDGALVADQMARGDLDMKVSVPEGASGKPWRLELSKAAEGVFEDVYDFAFSPNIPPFVADAPGRLLVPGQAPRDADGRN